MKEDENGIKNSILTIENIVLDDRGDYKCTATNPATEYGNADPASDTTFVRVKGKLYSFSNLTKKKYQTYYWVMDVEFSI